MKTFSLFPAILAFACLLPVPPVHAGDQPVPTVKKKAVAKKASPVPLHTIEGVGGVFVTPLAYLTNPGPPGTEAGLPSASMTYVKANRKNLETVAVTETLYGRLELGYAAGRFGIGSLKEATREATGVNLGRNDVFLHMINARFLAVPEASFGCPLVPAITLGATFKANPGIDNLDRRLGGALTGIGYRSATGAAFTITATKALPHFGRALLVTLGGRATNEAHLGYLGFGNTFTPTFEGSLAWNATDWLWIAAEFRQKPASFGSLPGLVARYEM